MAQNTDVFTIDNMASTASTITLPQGISIYGGTTYGGGGGGYQYPINIVTNTATTYYPNWVGTGYTTGPVFTYEPDQATLDRLTIENVVDRMITQIDKKQPLVVCVDSDVTNQQMREIADTLTANGVHATVIRGARAGYGFPATNLPMEDKRVDVLARIGEMWERAPHTKLTDLLSWWDGSEMTDEAFAAAVEVHFLKVMNTTKNAL